MIIDHVSFLDMPTNNMVGYQIKDVPEDEFEHIVVLINANQESIMVDLPKSGWKVIANGQEVSRFGIGRVNNNTVSVAGLSMLILVAQPTMSPLTMMLLLLVGYVWVALMLFWELKKQKQVTQK